MRNPRLGRLTATFRSLCKPCRTLTRAPATVGGQAAAISLRWGREPSGQEPVQRTLTPRRNADRRL